MNFIIILLVILAFHYGFLLYYDFFPLPLPEPDCSKCQTDIIEDKTDPNYDGKGHFDDVQYKPRAQFDPDRTGNVIGRFERFEPNQKQSDTELEQFVQMNSLQRM